MNDNNYASCAANAGLAGAGNILDTNVTGHVGCVVMNYTTTAARANTLNVQTSDGTDMFKISANGSAYFKNTLDSTAATQFLNASGAAILSMDTISGLMDG